MTAHSNYTAVYEFDDGAWNVRVRGLRGCQTYGRSLQQAQARIREALALWLDVSPDELDIDDRFPSELAVVADGVSRARTAVERAAAVAQQQMCDAVRVLTDRGLSRRDAAVLLGLSHQRVQQLLDPG